MPDSRPRPPGRGRASIRPADPGPPLILFGAFDRHNLGDLLFPHLAARQATRPLVFAGLAARDLTPWGGHRVRAISEVAEAWGEAPADLLHVGGEILTCSRFEAAVMLQPPDQAATAIRRYERHPVEGDRWAQALNIPHQVAYVIPRSLFRRSRHFVFHGVGGIALDRLPAPLRDEALTALRAADRVCVRDAATHAHLAAAGIAAELAPDPAALTARLCAGEITHHSESGEVAALRSRFPRGYLAFQLSAAFGDDATLDQLAAQLARAQAACGLAIVCFCAGLAPWHDDPAVYEHLLARLPPGSPTAIFRSAHIWDLCALLAHATAFCGTSLHGRILASTFARPAVSLTRNANEPGKPAAYVATWDRAAGASVVTPAGLADALEAALSRDRAELASRADTLADQAATALRAALEAV
jgi:polysaccharide pyruvyl transferase